VAGVKKGMARWHEEGEPHSSLPHAHKSRGAFASPLPYELVVFEGGELDELRHLRPERLRYVVPHLVEGKAKKKEAELPVGPPAPTLTSQEEEGRQPTSCQPMTSGCSASICSLIIWRRCSHGSLKFHTLNVATLMGAHSAGGEAGREGCDGGKAHERVEVNAER